METSHATFSTAQEALQRLNYNIAMQRLVTTLQTYFFFFLQTIIQTYRYIGLYNNTYSFLLIYYNTNLCLCFQTIIETYVFAYGLLYKPTFSLTDYNTNLRFGFQTII